MGRAEKQFIERRMTHGSLFTGIGGFDLGFEWAGIKTIWQVEIDEFCRQLLELRFPGARRYADIRQVNPASLRGVDIVSGGFPCQDISVAGKHAGISGDRSGLWSEYFRIIRSLRPKFVVVENSSNLLSEGAGRILRDLASVGYDAQWSTIPACSLGAPHTRSRVFIVAYPDSFDGEAWMGSVEKWQEQVCQGNLRLRLPVWLQAASRFIGVDDGVRGRLYRSRVTALGNSVVPQIAYLIGRLIMECEPCQRYEEACDV